MWKEILVSMASALWNAVGSYLIEVGVDYLDREK
jgi:hypothetical protein